MMNKLESLINCNMCKSKRSKCGRQLPACSYCSERGIACVYSDKIWRRGVKEAGLNSFINKMRVGSSAKFRILTSMDGKKNKTPAFKYALFQPILQPIDFVDEYPQGTLTKIQSNGKQKFHTHILLMLSIQIIEYDSKLTPQIDFFLSKLELGIFGGLWKFSIHMNQEWIEELLSPIFEEKCIKSYFQTFHLMLTYLSKYKFYTNCNLI